MAVESSDLSIIIVSRNTVSLLQQCLASIETFLAKKLRFIAVVVDNNSSDGTRKWLTAYETNHGWLRTVFMDTNVGFARANNIGIRQSDSRNILLLNSDTYLIDDSPLEAVAYLDHQPGVFGCGCTLLNREKKEDVSFGSFTTLRVVMREIFTNRFSQLRGIVPRPNEPIRPIDFPCGAFFLIKRNLLGEIGGLDENFFMYFEEADLARRAWDRGYTIMYYGPTRIVHLRGGSSGCAGDALSTIFYQSLNRYLCKHHTVLEKMLLNLVLFIYFTGMMTASSLTGKKIALSHFARQRRGLLRAWLKIQPSM